MIRHTSNLYALSVLFLIGCGGNTDPKPLPPGNEGAAKVEIETIIENQEANIQIEKIITQDIAGPSSMISDIENNGLKDFRPDLLIPIEKGQTYAGSKMSLGLSFGVLGADMTYLTVHNRHDIGLKHYIAIQKLGSELDCGMLGNTQSMEGFEEAKSDPKKLGELMFKEYVSIDKYLRKNNRLETAAHIMTGGLVGSLYLVTAQLIDKELTSTFVDVILSQKKTIDELVNLYQKLDPTEENQTILEEMLKLQSAMNFDSTNLKKENVVKIYELTKILRSEMAE